MLFRLQIDQKAFQRRTLRRGTGFQPTDRRVGVRVGGQARAHPFALQQPNGLRVETLQIAIRLLPGQVNLQRAKEVNPGRKDLEVLDEKIPRHPEKRHLHGRRHVLIDTKDVTMWDVGILE